ncbi:two component, sigma54 specific, transcriptional regulator, Fis family [Polaromonas sp. OV174]|uniref:sigma-54-dependent transcriptional regulator n=1 Tax=Polaromonas sp. OV174 TaxID=1855300 RepID=UPI0008EA6736|nr:sigma-54 dependent transcriptional regulator [Polaromonas sp. OV174]SFC01976.1 two component, sigma54 specific, transcriptional regulator, Fis family [Polaromonas sp. OV174]
MSLQAPAFAPARILVIDDEPDLRTLYELTLLREGYRVEAAGDLLQAREHLKEQRFDAVITDMRLPDGLGLELLRDLATQQRSERCVVITAHGSAENAVEALKAGAFDYLTKPVDLKQFRSVVASAIQGSKNFEPPLLQGEARMPAPVAGPTATAAKPGDASALAKLVGESPLMRAVKARIVKVAGSMAPILIQGESGTGKELVARAVHDCSHRAASPFVAVNCSAIPENLLEAEFFGARKGAYTGATQDRLGLFQTAKGGTLFLDEIGDLPLTMQSKLLRAIQERTVRPLGSTQEDTVDVRIVSATHKDLAAEVLAGSFRQDLYYRLNVIEIVMPALRERLEDLPALCQALLCRICQESGFAPPELSPPMLEQLRSRPFNGNVRELENILHRAVALGEDSGLHFDAAPESHVVIPENLQDFLDQQERNILIKVLQETGFNRTAAAAKLGLSLRQIRYRIARLEIATPGNDDAGDAADEPA